MITCREFGRTDSVRYRREMEMLSQREIRGMLAHDSATAERVAMVAKVQRKRAERDRTLARRRDRAAKHSAQGRM